MLKFDHTTLGTSVPPLHTGLPQVAPALPLRTRLGGLVRGGLQTSAVVGIVAIVTVALAERAMPYSWKPSTMLGSYGGNQEAAHVLTALEAQRALVSMQQQEAARAQQETIGVQAANERASRAYEALFARGTAYAQAWANGAMQALVIDTQTKGEVLKTSRGDISGTKEQLGFLCDAARLFLQTPDCGNAMRQSARQDRDAISEEIVANYRKQSQVIAASLRDWSNGLPDPAELMAAQAAAVNQVMQAAPRLPVPPPPIYGKPPVAVPLPAPGALVPVAH